MINDSGATATRHQREVWLGVQAHSKGRRWDGRAFAARRYPSYGRNGGICPLSLCYTSLVFALLLHADNTGSHESELWSVDSKFTSKLYVPYVP